MKKLTSMLLALITFGFLPPAFALEGESIVFNPASGNYLITYQNSEDGTFHQVTFIPATKIDPTVKTELKLDHKGDIHYGYTLISGRDSQQDIVHIILDPVSSVTTSQPDIPLDTPPLQGPIDSLKIAQMTNDMLNTAHYFDTPALWKASMAYSMGQKSFRIGWRTKVTNGMRAGGRADFGFKSRDLPGIILVEVHGIAPDSEEIPGEEGPDPNDGGFGRQYTDLIGMRNFIPRPAAVPAISVTKPFDGVKVLKQLMANVATWPDMTMSDNTTWPHMKLIDSTTATAIDASLQTAMDDLSSGNNEAAIRTLKSIRSQLNQMLSNGKLDSDRDTPQGKNDAAKANKDNKAEHAEANRKLVGDVLQFDLKYISRALGSDEKMDESEKR
jgi:hypothetical protein